MTGFNKMPALLESMREARSFQPRVVTGTTGISCEAEVEFDPPFPAPPVVSVLNHWDGDRMVSAEITNVSPSGCTVKTKRSLGVLGVGLPVFDDVPSTNYSLLLFEALPQ